VGILIMAGKPEVFSPSDPSGGKFMKGKYPLLVKFMKVNILNVLPQGKVIKCKYILCLFLPHSVPKSPLVLVQGLWVILIMTKLKSCRQVPHGLF
jgi:hypothetical protein